MEHKHNWISQPIRQEDGEMNMLCKHDTHLSYKMMQFCDCGVYRLKEFIHIEDLEDKIKTENEIIKK